MPVTRTEKEGEGDDAKDVEVTEDETLNSQKAIWLRAKTEISDEDYSEFYKHISHDFNDPAKVVHYSAEGAIEFKALLFVPEKRPFDMLMGGGDFRLFISMNIWFMVLSIQFSR